MDVTEIRRLADMVKIITLELAHAFVKEQVGDKKFFSCTFRRSGFLLYL